MSDLLRPTCGRAPLAGGVESCRPRRGGVIVGDLSRARAPLGDRVRERERERVRERPEGLEAVGVLDLGRPRLAAGRGDAASGGGGDGGAGDVERDRLAARAPPRLPPPSDGLARSGGVIDRSLPRGEGDLRRVDGDGERR